VRSLCVFCGSSPGRSPAFAEAGRRLGAALATRGVRLVYGGGRVGIMGEVADAVLSAGGEAVGVIPRALVEREVGHTGLTELRVVESMHERKALMAELSDGFAALPGGIGTMEELFEVWTWGQLGLHRKPYALLDVEGYYRPLTAFLDHMVEEGFLPEGHRAMLLVESDPERMLERLADLRPPRVPRRIGRGQT
jgi:uncharacterized protein (TIGR00730 family)